MPISTKADPLPKKPQDAGNYDAEAEVVFWRRYTSFYLVLPRGTSSRLLYAFRFFFPFNSV